MKLDHEKTQPGAMEVGAQITAICQGIAEKYAFELSEVILRREQGETWLARFLLKGSLRLEFELDRRLHQARLEDFEGPYGSVCQKYSLATQSGQGQVEQFSPFDDGPPWPTKLSVEEWSVRILSCFLENRALGYVH
ncbi:MAG TPA: hypothetical protein VF518_10350 [Polyangia bacterium]